MAKVLSSLPTFDVALAILAVALLCLVELAKSLRWHCLLGAHRPSFQVCLQALVAGQLTNALSPLRAGEAVRIGIVAARGVPIVPAAGAMAGAKAIDTLSLAAIALSVIGTASVTNSRLGLLAGGLILIAGVVVALKGQALRGQLEAHRLTRKLRLAALVDVAETLHDRRTLLVVLATTTLVWVAGMAANGAVLAAVKVTPTFDLMARVLVAGYIVGLVPAPPARLGVFETGITVALTSAGVPLPQAIAAAVTLHVCQLAELGLLMAVGTFARRRSWAGRTS